MRDAEKVRFLDTPISQAGLFGRNCGGVCAAVLHSKEADGGHQTHASTCSERQPSSAEAAAPICSTPREAPCDSSSGPSLLYDSQTLFPPTRTCGHTPLVFPHVLKQRVRSDDHPRQGDPLFGSHHTNSPGKTATGLQGFLPPATGSFSSHSSPTPGT
ncbi:hypothetical protein M9458_008588, partial [Cirrhinus mrigala]